MDQMEITIYAKRRCPHCRRAKRFLRRRGYAFAAVDMTDDGGLRAWLGCFTDRKTVPYFFVDHRPVGGFRIIQALDRSGDLERLVWGKV